MKQELYLKTVFCCMACDGDIAQEEIEMVKAFTEHLPIFDGLDVEKILNGYVLAINQDGALFLQNCLNELAGEKLTPEEELQIVDLAIKMIEADNRVEYSEIKFFKKIRLRLNVSDEEILNKHPDKEDFLLRDTDAIEEPVWGKNIVFSNISLDLISDRL